MKRLTCLFAQKLPSCKNQFFKSVVQNVRTNVALTLLDFSKLKKSMSILKTFSGFLHSPLNLKTKGVMDGHNCLMLTINRIIVQEIGRFTHDFG